ncbi:unnamed protein product [Acanthoscelides obtectus]|uniref:Uncharacterized protein n=1 Tax=Acanthoscelides obtectus TaxID=200917 RepID=A0A9P0Q050_ACAOB|nr:unnamed protein product [Acanthoscelides obtectus]CAK1657427.1 hypothetical protein AOBTE_LOCUS20339 [Acanthoscelides obtectus]
MSLTSYLSVYVLCSYRYSFLCYKFYVLFLTWRSALFPSFSVLVFCNLFFWERKRHADAILISIRYFFRVLYDASIS